MNPTQPPQKTGIGAPQQQITKENAKPEMIKAIQESNVDPRNFIKLGDMASQAIQNRSFYPMVVDAAVRMGIAEPGDLGGKINYQNLAIMVAFGNVAKEMVGQGGVKA